MDFNSVMYLLARQDLKARRRRIRNASPQERRLWKEVLRNYPVPFLRECTVVSRRSLPVSFYCHDLRLSVDVLRDPGEDEARRIGVANRERNLRGVGVYPVFVFEQETEDMDAVRRRIDEAVRARSEWLEEKRKEKEKAASGGEEG